MRSVLAQLFPVILTLSWLSAATIGQAAPLLADAAQLDATLALLAQDRPAEPVAAVTAIAALFDLPPPLAFAPQPMAAVPAVTAASVVESGDLQIALTQVSITEGTNNLLRVQRAQNGRHDGLFLRSGVVTLRDLAQQATAQGLDGLQVTAGVVQLTRPLVIWQGASLVLEPGDVLQMDAASGAFLLSFGQLDMRGATLRSTALATAPETDYRPFVLISGAGTLRAADSTFQGLGMAGLGPFSGVVVSTRGLFAPDFAPVLQGNRFEDIGSFAVFGANGAVIAQNRFVATRSTAVILVQNQNAVVAANAIFATKGNAGLKVSDRSNALQITGNLIAGGAGNGILIDGGSSNIALGHNAVLANKQSGVAAKSVTCLTLDANVIAQNGATGLRMAMTDAAQVRHNALVLNQTAAVAVSDQPEGALLELGANLVAHNRIGLTGAALASITLSGNNLTAQLPRLFDGEFSQHQAAYLTADQQNGAATFQITQASARPPADFASLCGKE